ncbi:MAG TPA: phosphatase PAP2 family protein [Thermodesulfobacteriota bacterium]|nr:phosphatase PAP2 family protein [Thermodesulfobacteriota bacterium]
MTGESKLSAKLYRAALGIYSRIRRHPVPALALLLSAAGFLAFAELAGDVLEGENHQIDTTILLMMRNGSDLANPLGPPWFEEMMRDITGLGGVAVLTLVTIFSAVYLLLIKRRDLMLYLAAAAITGTIFSNLLKAGFSRPRPDVVPHEIVVYTASFPSGHSLVAAVIYLTLGVLLTEAQTRYRLRIYILSVAIVLTFLVGISRIYLGVHWPSDVLAGWLAGTAWAIMLWIAAHYYMNKYKVRDAGKETGGER